MNQSIVRFLLLLLGLAAFTGCSTVNDMVTSNIPTMHRGRTSIVVKLGEQKALLLKGRNVVAEADVSTGREGYSTPMGRFRVIRRDRNHRSGLYGDFVDRDDRVIIKNVDVRRTLRPPGTHLLGAPMPYFVEFKPGYGLHAGHLPGYPASHGCVRMSYWKARQFYDAARRGTPVTVKP